jgi:hypothetical protein
LTCDDSIDPLFAYIGEGSSTPRNERPARPPTLGRATVRLRGHREAVAKRRVGHKTRSMLDRDNIVSEGDPCDAAEKLDSVSA